VAAARLWTLVDREVGREIEIGAARELAARRRGIPDDRSTPVKAIDRRSNK